MNKCFIIICFDFSSFSDWVRGCETLDLPEDEKEELDEFIDKLYDDIDKGGKSFPYIR